MFVCRHHKYTGSFDRYQAGRAIVILFLWSFFGLKFTTGTVPFAVNEGSSPSTFVNTEDAL